MKTTSLIEEKFTVAVSMFPGCIVYVTFALSLYVAMMVKYFDVNTTVSLSLSV